MIFYGETEKNSMSFKIFKEKLNVKYGSNGKDIKPES
jgi:hypothetical protein